VHFSPVSPVSAFIAARFYIVAAKKPIEPSQR
jgi:hypothetical protein